MDASVGSTDVGNVQVFTSNDRGHSPEEIAEMAVQRIFYISQEADPHIRDQVMAYREKIKGVIAEYMKKAIASDRTTQALGSVTLGLADNSSAVPTAFLDFADTTWGSSSISNARGALIYNYTLTAAGSGSGVNNAAYPAVAVLDFGGDKSSSSGDFTITYPANDANNAMIRLA